MTAGQSSTQEAQRRREQARRLEREADNFDRGAEGERLVAAILDGLPEEYVVFHDLRLPAPSKSNVDHLVIGPRGVFTVDAKNFTHPVTRGVGRGADRLWTGPSPIRLEPAKWETSVVSERIGVRVDPFMCIISPALPDPVFDFDGVRICHPHRLVTELVKATSAPVDVQQAADAVRHVFGVEPARRQPASAPRRRPEPAGPSGAVTTLRWLLDQAWFRLLVVIVGFFFLLSLLPVVLSAASLMLTDSTQRFIEGMTPTTAAQTSTPPATAPPVIVTEPPPAVPFDVSCPTPGMGWVISFKWPGDLPAGVSSYAVRWQLNGGPVILHTTRAWDDPAWTPVGMLISNNSQLKIITEYQDEDRQTLASTEQSFEPPSGEC